MHADVEEAFAARDVARIGRVLVGMRRSLLVLTDAPDSMQRRQLVHNLQNRLEALLVPLLLDALAAHDLGARLPA